MRGWVDQVKLTTCSALFSQDCADPFVVQHGVSKLCSKKTPARANLVLLSAAAVALEMPQKSDRELFDAARQGDAEAFSTIVRRYQKRIYRLAAHMLRDATEAEDATQEAFVRAYGALDRFDGRSEPFTWMYRIATNLCLNLIRSRKNKRTAPADDPRLEALLVDRRPTSDPQVVAQDQELARALCAALDSLSDTLRTTIILVNVEGLSHAQAAAVLGCPEGTIAWRIHEARKKLRTELDERGFSEAGMEL